MAIPLDSTLIIESFWGLLLLFFRGFSGVEFLEATSALD